MVDYANWLNPLIQPKEITQSEVGFFKKLVRKGSLAIDIGANTGDLTVPMSIAAGVNGLVIALDPNTQVFAVLSANAKLNKDKAHIVPLPFAATETDGEFYFASSEASFSNGGLINDSSDNRHGKYKLKEKIKGINLEKYLNDYYKDWLPELSLIKVDTEGNDLAVLKTLESIIATYKPNILAEVFPTLTHDERTAMFNFFSKHGYRIYDIGHMDIAHEVSPVLLNDADEMARPPVASNIMAVH
ncbi:MAG: hypothetical protein NVS3B15_06460 [Sediminibacterium sp.]